MNYIYNNDPDFIQIPFSKRHFINFKLDVIIFKFNNYETLRYEIKDYNGNINLHLTNGNTCSHFCNKEEAEVIRDMHIKWQLANSIKEELES